MDTGSEGEADLPLDPPSLAISLGPQHPARGFETIDLNSQDSSFPNFKSYADILRSPNVPTIRDLEGPGRRHAEPRRQGGKVCSASVPARSRSMVQPSGPAAPPWRAPWTCVAAARLRAATLRPPSNSTRGHANTRGSRAGYASDVPFGFADGTPVSGDDIGPSGDNPSLCDDAVGLEEDEGFVDDTSKAANYDKAIWSSPNTSVLCDICLEEIDAGNRNMDNSQPEPIRTLPTSATIKPGLGWANGTVDADDEWWERHTKGNFELKKLRNGPLECLEQLEVMFHQVADDGSTSCIPEENMGNEKYECGAGDETDQTEADVSNAGIPRTNNPIKRANSTNSTVTSPVKNSKSPMVRIMKGMLETM